MSKTIVQVTSDFVKLIDSKLGKTNSSDLNDLAKDLFDEYREIAQIAQNVEHLIGAQLDLADFHKNKRDWHWQNKKSSNWIELHKKYHKERDAFFRKINNFLNQYYAYSNFCADLTVQSLPQDMKRNLSVKGFHSMVDCLSKQEFSTHKLRSLSESGKKIVAVNGYRSKQLNHRKTYKSSFLEVVRQTPLSKSVIEIKPVEYDKNFEEEFDVPVDAPDDVVVQSLYDKSDNLISTSYLIHVAVCSAKNGKGAKVSYHPIHAFDYYGHLKENGTHWHIFTRPGENLQNASDLFYQNGETKISTPDVWNAIVTLQKYVQKTTKLLRGI